VKKTEEKAEPSGSSSHKTFSQKAGSGINEKRAVKKMNHQKLGGRGKGTAGWKDPVSKGREEGPAHTLGIHGTQR
jgi:hypothetical protein